MVQLWWQRLTPHNKQQKCKIGTHAGQNRVETIDLDASNISELRLSSS